MSNEQIRIIGQEANFTNRPIKVLCVDDEVFNLEILEKRLNKINYEVISSQSGEEALEILTDGTGDIDVVLLDRMMSGMDGFDVLKKMKETPKLRDVSVVMQTAMTDQKEITKCIDAGAYYYILKPYRMSMLLSIVIAAAQDYRRLLELKYKAVSRDGAFELVKEWRFEYKTIEEAKSLAAYLSTFSSDHSSSIVVLAALMINAVEHGNLELGFEQKNEVVRDGRWEDEIQHRLSQNEYINRKVSVIFKKDSKKIAVHIKDDGKGFNWADYMNFSPIRMTEPNGRGIPMANSVSHGKIAFNDVGNEVIYNMPA